MDRQKKDKPMDFGAGDRVRCVKEDWDLHYPAKLVVGQVYTVKSVHPHPTSAGDFGVVLRYNPTCWTHTIFEKSHGEEEDP